jgi:hypothetical protein
LSDQTEKENRRLAGPEVCATRCTSRRRGAYDGSGRFTPTQKETRRQRRENMDPNYMARTAGDLRLVRSTLGR